MRESIRSLAWLPALFLVVACAPPDDDLADARDAEEDASTDMSAEAEAETPADADAEDEAEDGAAEEADAVPDVPPTCGFSYDSEFHYWRPEGSGAPYPVR
ncbi:MAG: hypothetical protein AAB112_01745, partial [Thermodesulfobacteriota bacterium]